QTSLEPPNPLQRTATDQPEEHQPPGDAARFRHAVAVDQPRKDDAVVFKIVTDAIQPFTLGSSDQPPLRSGGLIGAVPYESFTGALASVCRHELECRIGPHGLEHLIERTGGRVNADQKTFVDQPCGCPDGGVGAL